MELSFSQIIEALVFLGTIAGFWMKMQTKMKELDMRILMMEERLKQVEKQDDRILEKLDSISEQIKELTIEINNKQDRP